MIDVRQMIIANFLKNMRFPKNNTTPQRKVVMQPEVILTDISLYAYLILSNLLLDTECMKSMLK